MGHILWSTTICILSLFTTGHACFRRLDDQTSTNLEQIEQVSKAANNTFTKPKTGKSHRFLSGFEFVDNLGQIVNEFQTWWESYLQNYLLTNRFLVFGTQVTWEFGLFPSS